MIVVLTAIFGAAVDDYVSVDLVPFSAAVLVAVAVERHLVVCGVVANSPCVDRQLGHESKLTFCCSAVLKTTMLGYSLVPQWSLH